MNLTKETIVQNLKSNKPLLVSYGVKSIGLFGSYVRNEQKPDSDIDILIDMEEEKNNFDNFMLIYDLVEDIFGNYKVELVTKNSLSPHIGKYILEEVEYA